MTHTPQAIENAARAIYTATPRNRPYEQLSLAKKNALRAQATKVLTGDLGDTVLVPKSPSLEQMDAAGDAVSVYVKCAAAADRKVDVLDYALRSVVYRAMLAAAEDPNDQG